MQTVNAQPVLSLKNIGKQYNGTRVLEDISFDILPGQIIGLVGENGAGKTTLMRILFGMAVIAETGGYEGKILIDGQEVVFKSPHDALKAGIGMAHQEFSLLPGFTTVENILLNEESLKVTSLVDIFGKRMSVLDRGLMAHRAKKAIDKLGVKLDPDMLIKEMPVGHKQFTEIARELDRSGMKVLVLDEPTAVLTESEAETLLLSIKKLASEGIAIIFISHRLREIIDICDTVVVLRDGKLVQNMSTKNLEIKDIASMMVGRSFESDTASRKKNKNAASTFLEVNKLWVDMPGETVRSVSFTVDKGEIFGIGGLAGQGKLGIPNGIMGLHPSGGTITMDGKTVPLNNAKASLKAGMAFVSEDRRGIGLLLDEGIDWNIAFTAMQTQDIAIKPLLGGIFKWRSDAAMKKLADEYIEALDIKCTSVKQKASTLSGGNQQKICLAKAFALKPSILFVSEPTRGIDVGAKKLVLNALKKYNEEYGMTIVMVSSELEELRSICDRISIVSEGTIVGTLEPDAPIENFGLLMAGDIDSLNKAAL